MYLAGYRILRGSIKKMNNEVIPTIDIDVFDYFFKTDWRQIETIIGRTMCGFCGLYQSQFEPTTRKPWPLNNTLVCCMTPWKLPYPVHLGFGIKSNPLSL